MSSCEVDTLNRKEISPSPRNQHSLSQAVSYTGMGLFSGISVTMRFVPAEAGTGIRFKRVDLPSSESFPADVKHIHSTPRCTILGAGDVKVQCVEHVLSALKALEIDNLIIELDGPEVPVGDGSALPFVEMIEKGGLVDQKTSTNPFRLKVPIYWSDNGVQLIAIPSEHARFTYALSYPNHPLLHSQFYSYILTRESFKEKIAPCRTFSLYEEIIPLLNNGTIKGGRLENGIVIREEEVLNPEGLRFSDEMVRHKVLDLIGDLSLLGRPLLAHVIAIRSGHYSNARMACEIVKHMNEEEVKA